jgi:regulator of sigma E protease
VSFFVAVVGLGFLVLVHELGHFSASLALGMRPRKFYIGFPPAVVKTVRRGIEYGIGAIPLGGFVKIPGMHRPAPGDVDARFARAAAEAPDLAGPIERLRWSLNVGDDVSARSASATLRTLATDRELSPGARASTERALDDIDDALGPDAYWRAPTWKRVIVIAAGPAANMLLTVVLLIALFASTGGKATTRVAEVATKSPAAKAGLRSGDQILEIGGVPVVAKDIPKRIQTSHGRPLVLTVMRGDKQLELGPVAPRVTDGVYRLGFALHGVGLPLPQATTAAFRVTGEVTRDIVSTIGHLTTGKGRDQISSPVGIVQGSSEAVRQGTDSYLSVLALISLSIALLNLLPLLPLDGGHIAFAVVEGVRGRALAREVYERVSVVGIALVVLLFVIGLSNDIPNIS